MTVTSLETSKEIFELLAWDFNPDHITNYYLKTGKVYNGTDPHTSRSYVCPAYDLAYLLDKLPHKSNGGKWRLVVQKEWHNGKGVAWYYASYVHVNDNGHFKPIQDQTSMHLVEADNPTEAAGLLVIKLAEEGILKK